MLTRDLSKEVLYEGVKTLLEANSNHLHLSQQKLYTLVSIGFQYLLYLSTKTSGHYIVRIEDSYLLDKIQRKAKDDSTRKFMQRLALPRRLKFGTSTFHLDFFNLSTWAATNELPKDKIQAALIIKNASKNPLMFDATDDEEEHMKAILASLPANYYQSSLQEFVPKTITIAFDETFEGTTEVFFPFIKEEPREKSVKGVNLASDIDASDFE